MPDHRGRTQHEQSAQVAITLFGNSPLALFAAAAVLSGHQPYPGCKVPSGVELKRVGNRGDAPQYCLASCIDPVQLEDPLGDVQTDCGNLHGGRLLQLVALNGPSLAYRCRQGSSTASEP